MSPKKALEQYRLVRTFESAHRFGGMPFVKLIHTQMTNQEVLGLQVEAVQEILVDCFERGERYPEKVYIETYAGTHDYHVNNISWIRASQEPAKCASFTQEIDVAWFLENNPIGGV